MILNGAAIRRASVGFQVLFNQGWEAAAPFYPDWCMRSDSLGSAETYHLDGGLPEMREWVGERQRQNLKRYAYELRNRKWELTINIPSDAFKDDKLGLFRQRFAQMGTAAKIHPDKLLADLLTGAFASNGYDEVPFIGATHPMLVGGTQSNKVAGALSTTTFKEAYTKLRSMKDDYNKPIDVFAVGGKPTLVVGPDLEDTAREILLVERLASGATNSQFKRAELKVFNRLTGNYWFLGIMGASLRPFIHQVREDAQVVAKDQPGDETVWNRDEIEYGVNGRWALGYGMWQLMVGSTGA